MPPVGAAIATFAASATAASVGTFVTSLVGRMLVSVATSALIAALTAPDAAARQGGGISTSVTLSGSTNPASFIMGRYATGGVMVCPPMSHGEAGKTPNAYLTYVIGLSCVAGCSLVQLILDGEIVTLGGAAHADYGTPMQGRYNGYGWVKYYDGSQTAADPGLLAKYSSYPKRPWSADMIGRGLCYAIITMRYNPELWQGFPAWRFVLDGIPLYDPRKDTTAGGSGAHRWATPSTWEQTNNAFNLIHQVMRGITLPWGNVWGGGFAAARLPYASWAAAMNECARAVDNASGGTEAQFRAGFEVKVDRQPADIIGEFLKASSGRLAEIGGTWKARAGATGLPVYFMTDADGIVTQAEEYRPFPPLAQTFNGVSATYPEPASRWESKPAPPRYNATWEAEDGGRRLVADLALPAVPYPDQVQRLTKALAADNRKWRRHVRPLPPDAFVVEPLDTVSWTSTANGYTDKVFEVGAQTDDLLTVIQKLGLRETDPDDYSYPGTIWLPSAASAPGTNVPAAQTVPGFQVEALGIPGASGTPKIPGLRLRWNGDGQDDVTGLKWETRLTATGVVVARGSTHDVTGGILDTTTGILKDTLYQARARFIADRATVWTNWVDATEATPNLGITDDDFQEGSVYDLLKAAGMAPVEIVTTLPTIGNFEGRTVFLTTDNKLYRWTGTAWTAAVETVDLVGQIVADQVADGAINTAKFATGIAPVEIVNALPTTGNFEGRTVYLTTDDKLYRHTGTAWTAAVPAVDVTGQLTDAQIAAVAAAKLTGQITAPQIANSAVTADKIAAQAVTTAKFASGIAPVEIVASLPATGNFEGRTVYLTTDDKVYRHTGSPTGSAGFTAAVPAADVTGQLTNAQIADIAAAKLTGQITAPQIADGAVTDAKIAGMAAAKVTGQLTDAQIAAVAAAKLTGQITAPQIANAAVTADKIADAAVTTSKFATGIAPVEIVAALPTTGNFEGRTVYLTTDDKLYRYTGSAFVSTVPAADITGQLLSAQIADAAITTAKFAAGIRPVEIVGSLPVTGNFEGRIVFLTTDDKLYRYTGSAWTAAIPAADITGQLLSAQIADAAITTAKFAAGIEPVEIVATLPTTGNFAGRIVFLTSDNKLYRHNGTAFVSTVPATDITGQLVATQIADAAITTAKFASGIAPVEIVGTLPTTNNFEGRTVYLTTDDKLYRFNGTAFVSTVPAADVTGTLTSAQIASLEAAKLTGQITSTQITDDAITTPKIAAGAVTASEIAAGAITTAKIAAGAVTATEISAGAITATKLATDSVTAGAIAAGAVSTSELAAGAVTAAKIAANAITANEIAAGAITTATIAADAITTDKIAAGAITATELAVDSVTAGAIAAGAVSTSELAAGAVTAAKISAGTITATEIASGAITTAKIAAGAVTATEIAAGAVTATKLAADSVTAGAIAAGAVSTSELAANAVTATQIAADAVTTDKIAANAVTASEIAAGAVTADKVAANAITAGKIAASAVSATEIAAGAVTTEKLAVGSGLNTVHNAQFYGGLSGWHAVAALGNTGVMSLRSGTSWTKPGGPVLQVYQPDAGTAGYVDVRPERVGETVNARFGWPVREGEAWEASAGISAHRCTVDVRIEWRNLAGTTLGYTAAASNTANPYSSTDPDLWPRLVSRGTAPTGAAYAVLHLRKNPTSSGADSYMLVYKPLLGPTVAQATEPLPWSPGGYTLVTGDTILTGSIQAANIAANAIDATKIAAGSITSVALASGSVTTAKLDAGAVTAATIAASAVTAAKLAAGSVEAAAIAAGAVQADKIAAGAVTADKVAANAIDATKVAAGSITSVQLASGSVTTAKLAAGAVTADTIAADAVTAAKIAANAVTASEIAAGAVTADKVAANAITAGKIAAGAVSATEIAAGAVTTEKLAVGSGLNTVHNGQFYGGLSGWHATAVSGNTGVMSLRSGTSWTKPGGPVLQVFQPDAGTAGYVDVRPERVGETGNARFGWPVREGEAWEASAGISAHRCTVNVRIEWRDLAGITLGYTAAASNTANPYSSTDPDLWPRLVSRGTAPTGAAYAVLHLRKNPTSSGADSYMLVYKPLLGPTVAQATEPLPWSPGGYTLVTGDTILTGSIQAANIAANAIDATKIAAGAITAVELASGAVTTAKLAAGAVTADTIAADAVTTAKIAAGAVTATEIAAGAVTASKIAADTITAGQIAAGAISASEIAAGAVNADKIAAGAITADAIAANAITAGKIAADAITADKIAANAITSAKIAADAITAGLIAAGAITADKIAANAITSVKIAADAITSAKISAGAVTAAKIQTGTLVQSLFSAGELQAALYPARMEFITASDPSWSPKLSGLMQVWVFGAGGGGGAAGDNGAECQAAGGGAGGLSIGFVPQALTSQTYALTVGAGGAGGNPGNADGAAAGGNGGFSRFTGNGVTFTGNGGAGGGANRASTALLAGGTGGTATGGSYNYTGGDGGDVDLTATGHRALASPGGAPFAATGSNGIGPSQASGGVSTLGSLLIPTGGRTVPSSFGADLEVSGFPMRGYDTWIGGSARSESPNVASGNVVGSAGAIGCGGGGGACRRVAPNSNWARGGAGGDGLIVVIYYRVGNFV